MQTPLSPFAGGGPLGEEKSGKVFNWTFRSLNHLHHHQYIVWLRITYEGSIHEMREWSIIITVPPDFKMVHSSSNRSLCIKCTLMIVSLSVYLSFVSLLFTFEFWLWRLQLSRHQQFDFLITWTFRLPIKHLVFGVPFTEPSLPRHLFRWPDCLFWVLLRIQISKQKSLAHLERGCWVATSFWSKNTWKWKFWPC